MVKIEGLKLAPGQEEALLRGKAARLLRVPEGDVLSLQVLRRSVDARESCGWCTPPRWSCGRRKPCCGGCGTGG